MIKPTSAFFTLLHLCTGLWNLQMQQFRNKKNKHFLIDTEYCIMHFYTGINIGPKLGLKEEERRTGGLCAKRTVPPNQGHLRHLRAMLSRSTDTVFLWNVENALSIKKENECIHHMKGLVSCSVLQFFALGFSHPKQLQIWNTALDIFVTSRYQFHEHFT